MKVSSLIKNKDLLKKIFPYDQTKFLTINPFNNEKLAEFPYDTNEQTNKIINSSFEAYKLWKNISLDKRLEKMENLSNSFIKHKENLAQLITLEMVLFV